MLAEDSLPPLRWQMVRIQKLYAGNDEINRVAKLKTSTGIIIRPIVELRKLPVEPNQSSANPQDQGNDSVQLKTV